MSGNNGILEKMAERVNGLPTGRLVEAYESLEESALLFERADRILARLGAGDRLALESAFRRMTRFGGDGMTPREAGVLCRAGMAAARRAAAMEPSRS